MSALSLAVGLSIKIAFGYCFESFYRTILFLFSYYFLTDQQLEKTRRRYRHVCVFSVSFANVWCVDVLFVRSPHNLT